MMRSVPTLYIDIDSLRPDHLGCYGYDAPTTPNIDEFAEDAVRFERAYVADSPCMPSRAALTTGRYGINNGVTTHGSAGRTLADVDGAPPTLPELFFEDRTRTSAVSSFPRHPATWFYHLWHEFHQAQEEPGEGFQSPRGEDVTRLAVDALDRHGDDEFFQYVQYWDPHAPYRRSDAEVERFRDHPAPPYPTADQVDDHLEWSAWRSAATPGLADEALQYVEADSIEDRSVLNELVSHYDAEISYVDRCVGELLDALDERGLYEDTLVVITADHGEELGEHGVYREHWSTHDGTQRVPLLVKPPTDEPVEPGARDHLVTNVDMAPTLADYAGLEAPDGWHGESLRSVVANSDAPGRDRIVVDHGLYTAQRAVRTDRWKFVRTYHPGMWPGVVPDRQLFDMEADPWEQENVADNHPDVVDDLETEMLRWAETHRSEHEDSLRVTAREEPAGMGLAEHFDGV
jgi:arylsulfatase A-like enzyme